MGKLLSSCQLRREAGYLACGAGLPHFYSYFLLFFCCCDKTLWLKQARDEKVLFGLTVAEGQSA